MTNGISFDDNVQGQEEPRRETRTERRDDDRPVRVERPARDEGRASMRNMGRTLARALTRSAAGEALMKAYNAFDTLFKDPNNNPAESGDMIRLDQYRITPFDHQQHRTDLSALIFSYELAAQGTTHVFYGTLLIEGSANGLAPVRCEERGRPFEIPRVAGDVYNTRFADKVFEVVSKIHGPAAEYHDVACNVIPADVDLTNDGQSLRNLAYYLNAAVETLSTEVLGYQEPFSLTWLEDDDSLDVSVNWSKDPEMTSTGQEVRTDCKLTIASNVRDSEGVFRDNLSRVGVSLELVYSPAQTMAANGFGARREVEETEIVTPLATITTLDTDFKAITLEMQMLGLASTAMLSDDLFWVNGFRPRDTDGFDPFDIGALNILAPEGKYFDVKSAKIGTNEFLEYFGTLCRRDLAYAMDVPERGDNTWINGVFIEAAQGDESALSRIFEAADALTDGKFTPIYRDAIAASRSPVNPFEDSGNRIILGWFKEGRDAPKQDLRQLDLLYWLNRRGQQDKGELALEWQDTFDGRDTEEVRIEKRLRLIEDVFGSSQYKVTGYARQIMINSVFIAALAAAVKDCDVRIDQSNTNNSYGTARVRGNFTIGRLAGSNLGGGLFGRYSRREENGGGRRGNRFFSGRGR